MVGGLAEEEADFAEGLGEGVFGGHGWREVLGGGEVFNGGGCKQPWLVEALRLRWMARVDYVLIKSYVSSIKK